MSTTGAQQETRPRRRFDICGAIERQVESDPSAEPADIARRVVAEVPDDCLRPLLEQLLPRRVTLEICDMGARRVASDSRLAA